MYRILHSHDVGTVVGDSIPQVAVSTVVSDSRPVLHNQLFLLFLQ